MGYPKARFGCFLEEKRLTQYGHNEISEKKTNQLLKFLSYFWSPIPWMIDCLGLAEAVWGRTQYLLQLRHG